MQNSKAKNDNFKKNSFIFDFKNRLDFPKYFFFKLKLHAEYFRLLFSFKNKF